METGCTKISAGWKNCYAEQLALRLRAMGNQRYRRGFRVTLHEDVLDLLALKTTKPGKKLRKSHHGFLASKLIHVNSMSDLWQGQKERDREDFVSLD